MKQITLAIALVLAASSTLRADEPAAQAGAETTAAASDLAQDQTRLAEQYKELERMILRMADVTALSDPKRAALLKKTFSESRQRQVDVRLEQLAKLLKNDELYQATKDQAAVQQDLKSLLDLLMSGQREKQITNERIEIKRYIERINKIIREEQGLQGETEGTSDAADLARRQEKVAGKTAKLVKDLEQFDQRHKPAGTDEADENSDEKSQQQGGQGDQGAQGESSQSKGRPSKQDKNDPSEKKDGETPRDESKDPQQKDDENKADLEKSPSQSEGKSGQESPEKPQEGSSGKPRPSQGGEGQQQEGSQESESSEGDQQQSQQSDESPARKRVKQAEERMRQAQRKLEDAQRRGAADEQQKAIEALQEAKAELEEILRQLREEEIERVLAMLEGRFRKMLQMQIEVYESTMRLDRIPEDQRDRDVEIEAGKLGRREMQIRAEADKTLNLLREEGSSVAFPESVEQMCEDIDQVSERLARTNIGEITQGIEQDIIKALEEMIAALQKAQQEQADRAAQGGAGAAGAAGNQPLVDMIAEIKMIRALQMRVNTRTQRYSRMLEEGVEQAQEPDLLEAVKRLSERERRIYRTTRDIVVGKNR